jgi:phage repressor protein C with HTH and peptisase S24 domain
MMPEYLEGDYILIKLTQSVRPDDLIVFYHNDFGKLFKKVSHIENDNIYVIGLNLRESNDSRQFGTISKNSVIGKKIFKIS